MRGNSTFSCLYLQVSFGGERSAADGADERLLSGVRPLVDLQGAGGREVLPADVAVVLLGRAAGGRRAEQRAHGRAAHRGEHWGDVQAEGLLLALGGEQGRSVAVQLGLDQAGRRAGDQEGGVRTCSWRPEHSWRYSVSLASL